MPPHSVVEKYMVKAASCLTRCQMELWLVCPTIVLIGDASILPLTISVISVTVAVIAAKFAPFLR